MQPDPAAVKTLPAPSDVLSLLRSGATLAVSVSGGKDSQAVLSAVLRHPDRASWPGRVVAIHADLGRAEWKGTGAFVQAMCDRAGVDLIVCRRDRGDLFDRFEERIATLSAKGSDAAFWPSAEQRYCTSDLKRGPIDSVLRRLAREGNGAVVSVDGLRADESAARAKRPTVALRPVSGKAFRDLTSAKAPADERVAAAVDAFLLGGTRGTVAVDWRPIFGFCEADVWDEIGTSTEDLRGRQARYALGDLSALTDWPAHPAYVYGNRRLSCAFCVLGCASDLANGARHNPEALAYLVTKEDETGKTFKTGQSLRGIVEAAGIDVDAVIASVAAVDSARYASVS